MTDQAPDAPGPIYVDLDGTLISGDVLWDGAGQLARRAPGRLMLIAARMIGGLARGKQALAEQMTVNPADLDYRAEVVEWLKAQRSAGRRIVLATASDQRVARAVADHLGLFDAVIASDGQTNRRGRGKLDAITKDAGDQPFEYAGDSSIDLPMWRAAERIVAVRPTGGLWRKLQQMNKPAELIGSPRRPLNAAMSAIRSHQWIKNVLVFVPLLASHDIDQLMLWWRAILAFIAFSAAASAGYVINDLLDMPADRSHPRKRHRPLASGELRPNGALLLASGLIAGGFALAGALLPGMFALVLAIYLVLSLGYSGYLKRKLMIDVITLAALYTLRVIGGGLAVERIASPWLLAFSMFLFVSLAFIKRYAELTSIDQRDHLAQRGRGYWLEDLPILPALGAASGYMAVLVMALYINDRQAEALYARPQLLWLVCPVLLYWITRLWILAGRGVVGDDPIAFAARDRGTWAAVIITAVVAVAAAL